VGTATPGPGGRLRLSLRIPSSPALPPVVKVETTFISEHYCWLHYGDTNQAPTSFATVLLPPSAALPPNPPTRPRLLHCLLSVCVAPLQPPPPSVATSSLARASPYFPSSPGSLSFSASPAPSLIYLSFAINRPVSLGSRNPLPARTPSGTWHLCMQPNALCRLVYNHDHQRHHPPQPRDGEHLTANRHRHRHRHIVIQSRPPITSCTGE